VKKVITLDIIKKVVSSNIELVGFKSNVTYVKFKNGTLYSYDKTSMQDFESLLKSESIGKYFNSSFKNSFEFSKLDDVEVKAKEEPKVELKKEPTE